MVDLCTERQVEHTQISVAVWQGVVAATRLAMEDPLHVECPECACTHGRSVGFQLSRRPISTQGLLTGTQAQAKDTFHTKGAHLVRTSASRESLGPRWKGCASAAAFPRPTPLASNASAKACTGTNSYGAALSAQYCCGGTRAPAHTLQGQYGDTSAHNSGG